jgi:hypothetical protein
MKIYFNFLYINMKLCFQIWSSKSIFTGENRKSMSLLLIIHQFFTGMPFGDALVRGKLIVIPHVLWPTLPLLHSCAAPHNVETQGVFAINHEHTYIINMYHRWKQHKNQYNYAHGKFIYYYYIFKSFHYKTIVVTEHEILYYLSWYSVCQKPRSPYVDTTLYNSTHTGRFVIYNILYYYVTYFKMSIPLF